MANNIHLECQQYFQCITCDDKRHYGYTTFWQHMERKHGMSGNNPFKRTLQVTEETETHMRCVWIWQVGKVITVDFEHHIYAEKAAAFRVRERRAELQEIII